MKIFVDKNYSQQKIYIKYSNSFPIKYYDVSYHVCNYKFNIFLLAFLYIIKLNLKSWKIPVTIINLPFSQIDYIVGYPW